MLLEFGANNFYSFKEGFEISLRLNSACPEKISHNKEYTNILAVKGANASGKTNVLKVLSFLSKFATNSFAEKPDENIHAYSYFNNDDAISIFIVFIANKIEYRYELEFTNKRIISEILYKKVQRYTKVLERQGNKLIYLKGKLKDLEIMKLRDNASLISSAKQYELQSVAPIYNFFNSLIVTNVDIFGMHNNLPDYNKVSRYYYENPKTFEFTKNVLLSSDLGISDIFIHERKDPESGKDIFYPIFKYDKEGKDFLAYHDQSAGVKSLYIQLVYYDMALKYGGVLIFDEFDINLHPDLLPPLIDFFENEKKNTKNAQLIFTTHNSEIMDYLGKYRIVLVNKENNESFLYRLDEIPGDLLRNDRSISKVYENGRIGGKPRLNFENI